MQARYQLVTSTRQKLITAAAVALLAAMAMVPAARATSIVPEDESATDEASARSSVSNVEVTQDQIQFLEDNWYFNVADEESSDNPAAVEPDTDDQADEHRSQSVEEFEAMKRAPGLYTDSPEAASPTEEDSIDAGLAHDEMRFLEDNWHLDHGVFEDEDEAGLDSANPAPSRDDIQFAEDNWHFGTGEALTEDDSDDPGVSSTSRSNTDRADTLDGLRNSTDEVDAGRSHDELTYPWGGFREHDY